MEALPEDIHDYVFSFIADLRDLLTVIQTNHLFRSIAKRYRQPLRVINTEHPEHKWLAIFTRICRVYRNLSTISFRRCNITERALCALLKHGMVTVDLRECRFLENKHHWLLYDNQLTLYSYETLALSKCSRLPSFATILTACQTVNPRLQCLCIDLQSMHRANAHLLPQCLPNLRTCALINCNLHETSLTFLTHFKRLNALFLGGSTLFNPALKHKLFSVDAILRMIHVVERKLCQLLSLDDDKYDNDAGSDDAAGSDDDGDDNVAIEFVVHALSQVLATIAVLHQNGVQILEVSFSRPHTLSMDRLYRSQLQRTSTHFDGLSVTRVIFMHLLHKYFASRMTILDFQSYCDVHHLVHDTFRSRPDVQLAINFVLENGSDEFGHTALHFAAMDGDDAYATQLLQLDAHLNCELRDRRGGTPLFYASQHNHPNVVRRLIAFGADMWKKKGTRETPLEICCMRSHLECIEIMIAAASLAQLNDVSKYDNQWSPVHCCCIANNAHILAILIAAGLCYSAQNHWKQTPLHICAVKNLQQCANILLHQYDLHDIRKTDEFCKTAKRVALQHNSHAIVKMIQHREQQLMDAHAQRHPEAHNLPRYQRRNERDLRSVSSHYGNDDGNGNGRERNFDRGGGRGRGRGRVRGASRTTFVWKRKS